MSRSESMAAIAALFALFAMGMHGSVAWAQGEDRNSCVDACEDAKERCVNTCGTHDNPMECEENCQETAEACTRECR